MSALIYSFKQNALKRLAGFSILIFLFGIPLMQAKDIPAKPNPPHFVNDFAGMLSDDEEQNLESKLYAYFDSTSTQIAIVTEQSLDGDDIFDYCQRLAETWGIGEKGKNNGILIYIAVEDRKMRIHPGYGMEADITDALTSRIINDYMKPSFREKDYYAGLDQATTILIQAASGEYVNDRPRGRSHRGTPGWLIAVILILVILSLINRRGGGRGRGWGGGPFIGTFGGGGFSGGWGGGSSGGGFSGFGGGSFGGGGSSGSW